MHEMYVHCVRIQIQSNVKLHKAFFIKTENVHAKNA